MRRKIFGTIAGSVIIVLAVVFFYKASEKEEVFKANMVFTNAFIVNTSTDSKGRLQLYYYYMVDGKKIDGRQLAPEIHLWADSLLLNHIVPVAYSKKDTNNSKLLISSRAFKRIGREMPDSLAWLKPFEKK